jgi:hypothetical protein
MQTFLLNLGSTYMFTFQKDKNVGHNSPMIVSYHINAIKIYYAASRLVYFRNKNILFYFGKSTTTLELYVHRCKVRSRTLGPGSNRTVVSCKACSDIPFSTAQQLAQCI